MVKVPRTEPATVRVEEAAAPRLTMDGLREVVRPVPEVEAAIVMKPVKPFRLPSVTTEDPRKPALMDMVDGLMEMLKSTILTVTVAE